MFRSALLFVVAIFVLAGCNEGERRSASAPPPPSAGRASGEGDSKEVVVTAQMRERAPKLAYSHDLSLEMAAATVAPRFEKTRNACLEQAELNCSLVSASIYVGDVNTGQPPQATLSVRLPHDQIAAFEKILFTRLEGEGEGEPLLRQRTTNAEDLTYAIADNDRRLAQATDYRERLLALSKQSGAKVADLIQIEEKLSEVQSEIEQMTADQRGMNLRVDTELMNVTLSAHPSLAVATSPLAEAWRDATRVLGQSAASAFTFLVVAIPWLPIIALAGYLLSRLWRLLRRRRARAAPVAESAVSGSA
jgi:hypothetical protein